MKKIIIPEAVKSLIGRQQTFLDREDVVTLPAASNEDALSLHSAERVDLIIVPLDSGTMSGELFCSLVRESEELRSVSLIVVHSGSSRDIERLLACRANACIGMTADAAPLLDTVHRLIHIPVRESYRAPISVKVQGELDAKPFLGYSENISASGMLFDAEKNLCQGDKIVCSFILPNSTRISTGAEVLRVGGKFSEFDVNQYGIRFLDLAADFRAAIESYVRTRVEIP